MSRCPPACCWLHSNTSEGLRSVTLLDLAARWLVPQTATAAARVLTLRKTVDCCAVSFQAEDDAARLAQYLEGRGQAEMAADVWVNASQAERAISLYAQVRGCVELVTGGLSAASSCRSLLAALGAGQPWVQCCSCLAMTSHERSELPSCGARKGTACQMQHACEPRCHRCSMASCCTGFAVPRSLAFPTGRRHKR